MAIKLTLLGNRFPDHCGPGNESDSILNAISEKALENNLKQIFTSDVDFYVMLWRKNDDLHGYVYTGIGTIDGETVYFIEILRRYNEVNNWNDHPPTTSVSRWQSFSFQELWRYHFSAFCLSVTKGFCATEQDVDAVRVGLGYVPSEDQSFVIKQLAVVLNGQHYTLTPISVTRPSPVQPVG